MKLHFVINEFAGNGRGKKVWNRIREDLTSPFSYSTTQYNGHASEIANQLAKDAFEDGQDILIIAIGGDGTIHEVVNGLIGYQHVQLGVVSAGSGNDFSRCYFTFQSGNEIDVFLSLSQDTQMIQEFDCGIVEWENGREVRFVNNSGIGFDAFVGDQANRSNIKKYLNKIGLGKLSYIYFVVLGLLTFELFDITVEQNGIKKTYKKVWFACVSNQPYFGGGMKISPQSKPNDGRLELTIVYNLSRLKLLLVFITVFFGTHTRLKEVVQVNGEKFTLYINDELHCHTDGEIIGMTKKGSQLHYFVQSNCWKLSSFSRRLPPL